MNIMTEVAKLLGVMLGEEFEISGYEGKFYIYDYGFYCQPLDVGDVYIYPEPLLSLLLGESEIIKLPFKPKNGDRYWAWSTALKEASNMRWDESTYNYMSYKLGNCFRTKEEAETKGKEIMKQIMKEFEDE